MTLALRTLFLLALTITLCFAESHGDHSSEDLTENCNDDLAQLGFARPCTKKPTSSSSSPTPAATGKPNWCRFSNGTTVALGFTFIYNNCSVCECTSLKSFRCKPFDCLPTYCADNSLPSRRPGQCCAQCKSDTSSDACLHNGLNYPHGTLMRSVEGKMQCWCQWGQIECRQFTSSMFSGFDALSDRATLTVIGLVLFVVLIFGLLVCCSCSLIFYYYFQRNQQSIQQAYDQYLNSMGWQPMEGESEEQKQAEEYPAEVYSGVEEKQYEAEQVEYQVGTIPPPYAMFDEAYPSKEQEQNKQ